MVREKELQCEGSDYLAHLNCVNSLFHPIKKNKKKIVVIKLYKSGVTSCSLFPKVTVLMVSLNNECKLRL